MNLIEEPYLSLATFRRSGAEVRTPVWFASSDDRTHYVFSAADAGKVKRLRNSSKSRVARCDVRGGSLGEWLDANAYLVEDAAEIAKAYRHLNDKYGWRMRMTDFFSKLSGRYNRRAIIRIELS